MTMAPRAGSATVKGVRGRIVAAVVWIRRPELGLLGQGIRYAIAGATVASVSLAGTIVLAEGAGFAYEVAFAIAYSAAVVTHFILQRYFVWSHHEEYALPLHLQLVRYLPIAATNYGIVAGALALLPHALHTSSLHVYLVSTVSMTAISFLLFRTSVFHAQGGAEESG
jgi:putative flippase GtrA